MSLPIAVVDAFASAPFEGNPAAVCVLERAHDETWMQHVACEMNLPATAFLHPSGDGYALRWFKSAIELELCGHGTLASSHVLWESGCLPAGAPARFSTRAGELTARLRDGWIELDFPATPDECTQPPPGLLEALGVRAMYVGRSRLDYIIEVDGEDIVRKLEPNFAALAGVRTRGAIVTSRSSEHSSGGYDFVSRFFAPSTGLNEDSVTGSAHCCLGPFWSRRLNKTALVGRQVSARGGTVRIALDGDRVRLSGQAVTIMRGELARAVALG